MICTYFKLCVLELSEKNAARQGGGGGPPSTPRTWRQFFHPVHTYFIDTGWGGGGVSAQILRERTAVVSGAIERFFKSEPLVYLRAIERGANLKICKMSARAIAILG